MNLVFFVILLAIPVLLMGLTYHNVYAVELKVLESQLNNNIHHGSDTKSI